MTAEIPDIPFVNKNEELQKMVKPLQMWMKQMLRKEWEFTTSPYPEVIQYSTLPTSDGQYCIRSLIQIHKDKKVVLETLNDPQVMKSFLPTITELRLLLADQSENCLFYETQTMPFGSLTTSREFVYVTCKSTTTDGDYYISTSVNHSKENKLNDNYVRGYKKNGIRIYTDPNKRDTTCLDIILVADIRGWALGYVTNQFLVNQLKQYVMLKRHLEEN
ncbi:START domain-containing protein [Entamoeba marina]